MRRLYLALGTLAALAAACSGGGTATNLAPTASTSENQLLLFLVSSDASPGENRIPFALRRADGTRVDAEPSEVTLTYRHRDDGTTLTAPPPVFRPWPVGGGVFTTTANYDRPGIWDYTVTVSRPGGAAENATATTLVKESPSTPEVGSPAPVVASKTATTPEELSLITSDATPRPELYKISFDEAVASGKPVVVTFSTPAWCQTQTCGPQVDTLDEVRQRHAGAAHFIHVELFDNPAEMRETGDPSVAVEAPAVAPWGLPSEPWTFVVDAAGRVAAKFEAYTTAEEIEEALEAVLAG